MAVLGRRGGRRMPRVHLKRKEYAVKDFVGWVLMTGKELGLKKQDIAEKLNISSQSLSYKLNTGKFDIKEVLTLFETLEAEDEEILKLMKL